MFSEWRRKREVKRLQAACPHEWHITRVFRAFTGFLSTDFEDMCDVYCPICDKVVTNVARWRANRVLKQQEIRRKYEEAKS